MNNPIEIIGGAMRAEAETLRVIGQNVANAETIAYRRQVPVTHLQFDSLINDVLGGVSQSQTAPQSSTQLAQTQIAFDFKTATLKSTGEPFNVALDGPGFFVLDSTKGTLLTRRGDLHVAADGTLVSFTGGAVLGEKGVIQVGSAVPSISSDGVVTVNGQVIDQLRIANIAPNAQVESLGDGTYRVDAQSLQEGDRSGVRQGFLEGSNVVPVNEMVQLMETMRRFETEQKVALAYSGMLDKSIGILGKAE